MSASKALTLALLLPLAAAGCSRRAQPLDVITDLRSYRFDPGSRLEDRIAPMPEEVLEAYRQADGMPGYKAYEPAAAEKALLLSYLRLMPAPVERLFREKCVGIFFIDGLKGNGITNWVGGPGPGEIYFFVALSRDSLERSLSETLTGRERSCFIPEKGFDIAVDAGRKYRGLAYALFHEAAHAVDYVAGITPFVEPGLPKDYSPSARPDGGLFTGVWQDYDRPLPKNEFPRRGEITFYGFGDGPKIPAFEAGGMHARLEKGPFISLYGAKSWAEDLAELTAFGLIAGRLGQPYRVTVSAPGAKPGVFEPMKGEAGRRAAAALALLEKL